MELPLTSGLKTAAFGDLRREAISRSVFALAVTGTAALALAARTAPDSDLLTAGVVVGLAGVVAIAADLRRRKVAWEGFRVTLTDEALETKTVRDVVRRVELSQIQHVVEAAWPARGLVVRGPPGKAAVFVPAALEHYDEVRSRLATLRPIEQSRVPETIVRLWPVVVVAVCAAIAFAVGSEKVLPVVLSSAFLGGVGLWSLTNVLRSRRIGLRGKLLSTLMLAPLAWLVWRVVRVFG